MSFDIMFFQLMQVALGEKPCLDRTLSDSEWEQMLAMARKQAVTGLMADAIEALPDGQKAPVGVRMTCASLTIAIERQNVQANRDCVDISTTSPCSCTRLCRNAASRDIAGRRWTDRCRTVG